ncbi:MAG: UbiA family prenyltransferase [Trueperaceae bacterium]|nr:MAG: UbiA family prenyltransferase [Trueperaceae bacterium]
MVRGGATNRWWIYQRERFPLVANGLLITALGLSAVGYSALLRGQQALPSLAVSVTACLSCFLFFLQLRISDEFKDYRDDLTYRPYRPLPRGLVTLKELGLIGLVAAVLQFFLALWLEPRLLLILVTVWAYLGLMSKEFFVAKWLKARPLVYLWSHMLILPSIILYATACDWVVAGETVPAPGLGWFLAFSLFNGVVLEIGRKLRAPEDEEEGVETYTVLYGRNRAVAFWLGALAMTALAAILAARQIAFLWPVLLLLGILVMVGAVLARGFLEQPVTSRAKRFELFSGLWTLSLYVSVGIVPALLRLGATPQL